MAPFVYRGAGKNQSKSNDPVQRACVKSACAIQLCLSRYGSDESKCKEYINAWKECREQVIARMTDEEKQTYHYTK